MISDVYFPRVNGVSTSIATFRRSLRQLGHQSTLVAPAYPQAAPEVSDFSAKVIRLLRQPGLRQRLSSEARDYARDWSTTIMSRRMADFYRRVVEQENGALLSSQASSR